jgi:hypothetical protein
MFNTSRDAKRKSDHIQFFDARTLLISRTKAIIIIKPLWNQQQQQQQQPQKE